MGKMASRGSVLVVAGVVVAAAVWASLSSAPSGEEAAGTIMQAERHQAKHRPAVKAASEVDEVTTERLSAEQLAEPGTDQGDTDRAKASEAAQALNTGNSDFQTCVYPNKC